MKKEIYQSVGYETYMENMFLVSAFLMGDIQKDKELGEAIKNHLFNKVDAKIKRKLTEREDVFSDLFYGMSEIVRCFECLKDAEVYIRSYPNAKSFKNAGITKAKYFRYHVEKYLEENYIMKCRLEAYINFVKKFWRKVPAKVEVMDQLLEEIKVGFSGVENTRGKHVHRRRFTSPDLERLDSFDLFTANIEKYKEFRLWHLYKERILFPQIRRDWKKTMSLNTATMKKLLKVFFEILNIMVFGEGGILNRRFGSDVKSSFKLENKH